MKQEVITCCGLDVVYLPWLKCGACFLGWRNGSWWPSGQAWVTKRCPQKGVKISWNGLPWGQAAVRGWVGPTVTEFLFRYVSSAPLALPTSGWARARSCARLLDFCLQNCDLPKHFFFGDMYSGISLWQ